MNVLELKEELDSLGVKENQYALKGDLNPDSIVLYHSYDEWQVFYLDERGGRNDERIFKSENEACLYIYQLFVESKRIEKDSGLRT